MADTAVAYQHSALPPPIPIKAARPASVLIMMMNNPAYNTPRYTHQPPQLENRYSYSGGPHSNSGHRRELSSSSGGYQLPQQLPAINTNTMHPITTYQHQGYPMTRRSGSTATNKTTNSTSTTSTSQHSAYVATIRAQKATVWCEIAQVVEDPRITAAQKLAKKRAMSKLNANGSPTGNPHEINNHGFGGGSSTRSNSPTNSIYAGISGGYYGTFSSSAKTNILVAAAVHSVKKKGNQMIVMDPRSLVVGAVPDRMSADEVDDSSDEEVDRFRQEERMQQRAPRSSRRPSQSSYGMNRPLHHTNSTGSNSSAEWQNSSSRSSSQYSQSTYQQYSPVSPQAPSMSRLPSITPTIAQYDMSGFLITPPHQQPLIHSQPHHSHQVPTATSRSASMPRRVDSYVARKPVPASGRSSSSTISNSYFGPLPVVEPLQIRPKMSAPATAAELRRRGSIDEKDARTRTMSGQRLFVVNPDK